MTAAAAAHTPKRGGEVAVAWRKLPVTKVPDGYESGTENPDYRARFLEHGTEPHEITPKRARALGLPNAPRGAAHHPGIKASHMTAKAAAEVEATLDVIAAPHLRRWAEEIEDNAAKHKGIRSL